MTGELTSLYQEVILDHNKKPRNFHKLETATHHADGYNPLCGDKITVYIRMEGDVLRDICFEGSGCAISKASASMMTESLKGRTRAQLAALFDLFHDLVTGQDKSKPGAAELGKLVVFSGVREFPVRVKCATLAWHTLRAALDNRQEPASTE
ncbi:MAG TPA: SUF system NifU family Fe-S cluster assembly protein [Patescibacteria group bacterium]|jgi:nitrogen fixation NifU-like protein|nr:SUF system NifU family Fe-S cluster assembly protein [Patescibacteria group bacterium]